MLNIVMQDRVTEYCKVIIDSMFAIKIKTSVLVI